MPQKLYLAIIQNPFLKNPTGVLSREPGWCFRVNPQRYVILTPLYIAENHIQVTESVGLYCNTCNHVVVDFYCNYEIRKSWLWNWSPSRLFSLLNTRHIHFFYNDCLLVVVIAPIHTAHSLQLHLQCEKWRKDPYSSFHKTVVSKM